MSNRQHRAAVQSATRRPGALTSVLLAVALAVASTEISARVVLSFPSLRERVAGDDDASWRLAWVERQRSAPGIYYTFDVFDETKGWMSRPGLRDVPVFGSKHLSTNSLGLRGTRELSTGPPPADGRIMLVGDSFTFGDEVSDEETFAAILATLMPEAEILNFGVHGYGHDQMLVLLRQYLRTVHPTRVLLFYVASDAGRNLLSFRDFAKPYFKLAGDRLELATGRLPTPATVLQQEWRRSRAVDLFVMLRRVWRERSGAQQRDMQRLTTALLEAIAQEVRQAGSDFWLVELPAPWEVGPGSGTDPLHAAILDKVCHTKAQPTCRSLRPALADGAGEAQLYKHWGPTAHRLIAEEVATWLSGSKRDT